MYKKIKPNFHYPLRRILFGIFAVFLVGLFIFIRSDASRVERIRMALLDKIIENTVWISAPVRYGAALFGDFRSHKALYEENQELRYELRKVKVWREAMIQLEKENAHLARLSQLRKQPEVQYISAIILADSGSPFRQSALVNLGEKDGIKEGWPAVDGIGLVGRIVGVGQEVSRVMFLSDPESRIPVVLEPTGERGLVVGDGSQFPLLRFVERAQDVLPGDRVVTSGEGGVLPASLLVGHVIRDNKDRLRVRPNEHYRALDMLSVLPIHEVERLDAPAQLLGSTHTGK